MVLIILCDAIIFCFLIFDLNFSFLIVLLLFAVDWLVVLVLHLIVLKLVGKVFSIVFSLFHLHLLIRTLVFFFKVVCFSWLTLLLGWLVSNLLLVVLLISVGLLDFLVLVHLIVPSVVHAIGVVSKMLVLTLVSNFGQVVLISIWVLHVR